LTDAVCSRSPRNGSRACMNGCFPSSSAAGRGAHIRIEFLFADPIADVAILGEPESQDLYEEWEQWIDLVERENAVPSLVFADEGTPQGCRPCASMGRFEPGMSSSPILDDGREGRRARFISMDGPCLRLPQTLRDGLNSAFFRNRSNREAPFRSRGSRRLSPKQQDPRPVKGALPLRRSPPESRRREPGLSTPR